MEKMFKRLLFGAGLDKVAGDWGGPASVRLFAMKREDDSSITSL